MTDEELIGLVAGAIVHTEPNYTSCHMPGDNAWAPSVARPVTVNSSPRDCADLMIECSDCHRLFDQQADKTLCQGCQDLDDGSPLSCAWLPDNGSAW
jgi:hypothetical protein